MSKLKTIREWLNELPEPYRSRAIKHYSVIYISGIDPKCISLKEAIEGAFMWDQTPEGHEFWDQVSMGETPELPEHLNEEE